MTTVTVLGAGAFGTALAIALAENGPVRMWARDADQAAEMQATRHNAKRLPDAALPDAITVCGSVGDALYDGPVLLAVPMQKLRAVLTANAPDLAGRALVACCKGIELTTGLGPSSVIAEAVPTAVPALLTGPSFAADIAKGLPTALTLACGDPDAGAALQERLSTFALRLYRTEDVAGAEIGGAMKNVIAIACGAAIGAGLGESARAALMTRGYAEMQRLAEPRDAQPETLAGLSGFGDLALTCTSAQSRNYRMGLSLGQGEDFDAGQTVEGAATARAVADEAARQGLDMPITRAVVALLDGDLTVSGAIEALLARPLKDELD
ncbi:NAD(P)H-dependent glycerol-3-phosphate dehydrogenase [Chachezhania antarctica]|uniref:NAD(P)H-dependent glycerol-3-phosphate dehydrogenase n=1 Tax=Chachezhania antarctica TaxID=2340860 RepID=UPI000EB17771|nr:NAD(P)H-dependent glycerol-3-phosphate dehydrogenase [Chachezhania antarctica]|tara:strand:+ start:8917 stop:9888 length:972 start_codon:yes stop_codon:yes gene_type:complete